jgi:hypothetical protein
LFVPERKTWKIFDMLLDGWVEIQINAFSHLQFLSYFGKSQANAFTGYVKDLYRQF